MNEPFDCDQRARRKFVRSGAALAASLSFASGVKATEVMPRRQRALLVGVSEYPTLAPRLQLAGPRNDIKAWLGYFAASASAFTANNISVLADGVSFSSAQLPTRANILSALDDAVLLARPGDFQLIYFAGHGSQMAQPAGSALPEADGLDEIFLPRDVGRWDGNVGRVTNAIIDDEIGDRLDAMRTKGANVFAIFDCCHAATMARAGFGARTRAVSAQELGMPSVRSHAVTKLTERVTLKTASPDVRGGALTIFYAAHGFEAATEEHLPRHWSQRNGTIPKDMPPPRSAWRGVFSFHLIEVLATLQIDMSKEAALRVLASEVSKRYLQERRVSPVPRYEFLAATSSPSRGIMPRQSDEINRNSREARH